MSTSTPTPNKPKKLKIACLQYATPYCSAHDNLALVKPLIQKAQTKGAKFILLPELALNKYSWEGCIAWSSAESLNSPQSQSTIKDLMELASKLNVYIALTFLEAEHNHFFNTFILLNPSGKIESNTKIRKEYPASNEAFVFTGYKNEHFINTKEFGQIGVAICYENHLRYFHVIPLFSRLYALYTISHEFVHDMI